MLKFEDIHAAYSTIDQVGRKVALAKELLTQNFVEEARVVMLAMQKQIQVALNNLGKEA